MCKEGETAYVTINVAVDKCLAPLIKMLNDYGIHTKFCCCGHKDEEGYILIEPRHLGLRKRIVGGGKEYTKEEVDALMLHDFYLKNFTSPRKS